MPAELIKNKNSESTRIEWIDAAKGMLITAMVWAHAALPGTKYINLFHMAVFFILSGIVYKPQYSDSKENLVLFIGKRIRTLWFPFVIANTLFLLLNNFFLKINIYSDNPALHDFQPNFSSGHYIGFAEFCRCFVRIIFMRSGTQLGGASWFLRSLLEVELAFCILQFCIKRIIRNVKSYTIQSWGGVFLLLIFSWILQKKNFTFPIGGSDFYQVCYILPLYKFGTDLKAFQFSGKWYFHCLLGVIAILMISISSRFGHIALGENHIENPLFFIVTSLAGFVLVYELSLFLTKVLKEKITCTVGKNTLYILLLHFLCFKIINFLVVMKDNLPFWQIAVFPVLRPNSLWGIGYVLAGVMLPCQFGLFLQYLRLRGEKRKYE